MEEDTYVDVVDDPVCLPSEQSNHPGKLLQMEGHHTQYSSAAGMMKGLQKDQMASCRIGTAQIMQKAVFG